MDSAGVWAFYYIQGEDGEDRSHPNAFKIPPAANGNGAADVTLADVLRHFPLQTQKAAFHFRFRINSATKGGGGGSTFFWLDVTNPAQKVPLVNGRVICKLLRLERPAKVGLIFKRKPVLKWANADGKSRHGSGSLDSSVKTTVQPLSRQQSAGSDAPFHRSSSSPAFEKDRPAKYSDGNGSGPPSSSKTNSSGGASAASGERSGGSSRTGSGKMEQTAPPESFEDFLSGGGQQQSSQSGAQKPPVNLMSDSGWNDAPTTPQKTSTSSFLSSMDPLAQVNNSTTNNRGSNASSAAPTEQPKFEDDNGQTVGPVTMAEMQKYAASTSDGSNVYNPNLVDKSTKSADVRRAMEERERQVQMDVEKAREELRQREEAKSTMTAMKENAALVLGPKLKSWAEDNGRTKNIRTLLSTMHQVMWDGSKWTEVNMGKLIQPNDVKKHYRKAMIVVHPDKSGGRNAEQLLIAERVFAAVNTAWEEFIKTNPC